MFPKVFEVFGVDEYEKKGDTKFPGDNIPGF